MTTRRSVLIVALVSAAFFAYAWAVTVNRPVVGAIRQSIGVAKDPPPPGVPFSDAYLKQFGRFGWYVGSADQLNYAREARALARGTLPGSDFDYENKRERAGHHPKELSDYAYPLGYPALGAAFIKLGFRGDPFLVPDVLLYIAIILLAFSLGSRLLRKPWNWVYPAALAAATPLTRYVTEPWNTTTTALAVLAVLWVTAEASDTWWSAALVAGTAALCVSSRIVDVVWPLGLLALACVLTKRVPKRTLLLTGAALAVTAGVMMWTQYRVFGNPFITPYHYHSEGQGIGLHSFSITAIPRHAWGVFVAGQRGFRSGVDPNPLFRESPWLLLAPIGLLVATRVRRDLRPWLLASAFVSVAASLYYLAYSFTTGANLENGVLRFFVTWIPLWTLLALMAIPGSIRTSGGLAASSEAAR